jgi:hypothetical protein
MVETRNVLLVVVDPSLCPKQREAQRVSKTVGKVVKARIPRARWTDGWMVYMWTENNSSLVFLFHNSNQGGVVVR